MSTQLTAFGCLFRIIRKQTGLTLRQYARRSGFNASYISLIENGHRVPGRTALDDLCEAMGLGPCRKLVLRLQCDYDRKLQPDEVQSQELLADIARSYDDSDLGQRDAISERIRAKLVRQRNRLVPPEITGVIIRPIIDEELSSRARKEVINMLAEIFREEYAIWK
jgi:transcriptional regulator with XRE-family HTH domain